MLRVVVDLYRLKSLNSGLGQFCLHLGRELAALENEPIRPTFFLRRNRAWLVRSRNVDLAYAWPWRKEQFVRGLRPLLERMLPRKSPIALWHSADQFCKFRPLDPRVPMLLTIHDLNFLRDRSRRGADLRLRALQSKVDRAEAIATVSNFAASEIREHLNLKGKEVRVIYNGTTFDEFATPERPRFVPEGRFLLSIGTVVARKNFHVLVDLMRRLPEYNLIVAGNKSRPYARQMESEVARADLRSRVILPGEVTDPERAWLYRNCEALLFPSLTEGFGLPVVEAMAHGKPVFLSDRTSLPEVGGSLGFYWKDFSATHMLEVFRGGMDAFRRTPEHAQKLIARAQTFSWQRTAREYMDLYKEMVGAATSHQPRPLPEGGLVRRGRRSIEQLGSQAAAPVGEH